MGVFEKLSSLHKLAQQYPSASDPAHISRVRQTVKFGVVRYRRCVGVGFDAQGLSLAVSPPLGKRMDLFIRWSEIKNVRSARLYWLPAVCLSIGSPEVGDIIIYKRLFEHIRGFLQPEP